MASSDSDASTVIQDQNLGPRDRTLTEKGQSLYDSNLADYYSRVNRAWRKIEDILVKFDECSKDIKLLRKLSDDLERSERKYLEASDELLSFLSRSKSGESMEEMESCQAKHHKCANIIDNFHKRIQEAKIDAAETLSVKSAKQSVKSELSGSTNTTGSSILMRKRMKADAQRARLKFIEKEIELQKQKATLSELEMKSKAENDRKIAELEANLHLLKQQGETAAVQALEAYDSQSGNRSIPSHIGEPIDRTLRTANYVNEHAQYTEGCKGQQGFSNGVYDEQHDLGTSPVGVSNVVKEFCEERRTLNADAKDFKPASQPEQSVVTNLTQFLLKKDLLLSRFTNFNDRPEAYSTWKTSFTNITKELNVTPFEELDLLVKWLGPESSRYAFSIRASNIGDPARGLERIWERLEERYGCPELVESALKAKLNNFPKLSNKENKKLYELADILAEIESTKENSRYSTLLAYFDSSSGILPVINKLPHTLQEKWTTRASSYKARFGVSYPPFHYLVEFVKEMSRVKNDPGFQYDTGPTIPKREKDQQKVISRMTGIIQKDNKDSEKKCPIHKTNHLLKDCRSFQTKPDAERKKFLKDKSICFRCCDSTQHVAKDCKANVKCKECGSERHHSVLHVKIEKPEPQQNHGGEKDLSDPKSSVTSSCTQICGNNFGGKSCAKTLLLKVYLEGHPERAVKLYAIIDDQSNKSLVRSEFFDLMNIESVAKEYTLSTCSGVVRAFGRRASGYMVEALDGSATLKLPTLIECDEIPNAREEIPTPDIARYHPHLVDLVPHIPPLDEEASILLLIGRDLLEAHHVLEQRIGQSSPYAQKLRLGWVLIGETCLTKVHKPDTVNVNKTNLANGRSSILKPCTNSFQVKVKDTCVVDEVIPLTENSKHDSLFERTPNDDKPGLSIEDREFLAIMDETFGKDQQGRWIAPLPFRTPRRRLPNNKAQAVKRALFLRKTLQKDPLKKEHFFSFMQGILDNHHAEIAPPLKEHEECWYLPIFGVYHPKKPSKVRAVFDSAAKFDNVCLNDVLLRGPDLTNSLLGVLLRFRKEPVAITADIQQMFFCFSVSEEHRNFLRFLWHRDNDPDRDLVEYRMCVHVFGNSPSPAVATYGLRKSMNTLPNVDEDVVHFVTKNFYVDDALTSLRTPEEAVDLMKRTQQALREGGTLRLHKIASNKKEVLDVFPLEDRAADLMNIDLTMDEAPLQRSLGLSWDLQTDSFTFQVSLQDKPFTRRGILSTLNSLYDPLGFVAPVVLQGRLLFRTFMDMSDSWDDPLPAEYEKAWQEWRDALQDLAFLEIPRTYVSASLQDSVRRELHIFSDASEKAVAAVAYIKVISASQDCHVGFLLGKVKVAPKHGHTIPRLELCAAVLASEISEVLEEQLDESVSLTRFYTDSKVVLGYLYNRTRRFYTYVSNRVDRILKVCRPEQWHYVPTEKNPADIGTRSVLAKDMKDSIWLKGPSCLSNDHSGDETFPLLDPDDDAEVRPHISTLKSEAEDVHLGTKRFEKFST